METREESSHAIGCNFFWSRKKQQWSFLVFTLRLQIVFYSSEGINENVGVAKYRKYM